MKLTELQPILERQPFRPFTVRLSGGQMYEFKESRDFGAPRKIKYTIYHFGLNQATMIDIENIVAVSSTQ